MIEKKCERIGIFGVAMKAGSDNYRESAIFDIIFELIEAGMQVVIFDRLLKKQNDLWGVPIERSIKIFKDKSDLILANRMDEELLDVSSKCLSRDLFGAD